MPKHLDEPIAYALWHHVDGNRDTGPLIGRRCDLSKAFTRGCSPLIARIRALRPALAGGPAVKF